jgi:hypothetical protein
LTANGRSDLLLGSLRAHFVHGAMLAADGRRVLLLLSAIRLHLALGAAEECVHVQL